MEGLRLIIDVIEGFRSIQGVRVRQEGSVGIGICFFCIDLVVGWFCFRFLVFLSGLVGLSLWGFCFCLFRDVGGRFMGFFRKMSSFFKRGSFKSFTSGLQKVSEFCGAVWGRWIEGLKDIDYQFYLLEYWQWVFVFCRWWWGGEGVLDIQSFCIRIFFWEVDLYFLVFFQMFVIFCLFLSLYIQFVVYIGGIGCCEFCKWLVLQGFCCFSVGFIFFFFR